MSYTQRSILFLVVASLLTARDNLPISTGSPPYAGVPAFDGNASTPVVNDTSSANRGTFSPLQISTTKPGSVRLTSASLLLAFSPQLSGNRSLMSGIPLAFSPAANQSPSLPSTLPAQAPAPKQANWARRHALLLSGLAMTGAGAAMVATPGTGQISGCYASGINGAVQCTTVSTWGGSSKHIAGILLLGAGLPVAIWGIFKHP